MQETRHTTSSARYLYGTPTGILEFRAAPTASGTIETLITHTTTCNGDQCATHGCDADNGADIALTWTACGDPGVWYELAAVAVANELAAVDTIPVEPSHEQRAFRAALIREGHHAATHPDH